MQYKDQSTSILQYHLFDHSDIDFSQFTILSDKTITIQEKEIYVGIIGESHFISIENEITELFACVKPKEKSFLYSKFENSFTYKNTINDITFATTFKKIQDIDTIEELIISFEKENLLYFEFPNQSSDLFKAVTAINLNEWKSSGNTIVTFQTIHSYPNENSLIFSSSCFFL